MNAGMVNRFVKLASLGACCLALFAASATAAPTVPLTDLTGATLTRMPVMHRGDVGIVPLAMLGKWGGYDIEVTRGKYNVTSNSCLTVLEPRNNFAEVNGSFIQMVTAPELWDGSLWLPLPNLAELFPTTIELSDSGTTVRLLGVLDSTQGVVRSLSALTQTEWRFGKVILDPGHGGKDPGGDGLTTQTEKEIVLDIARRAEQVLKREGIPVVLTRRDDAFMTLGQRTRMANAESGDLFLSIHCNSYTDPSIGGAECYILKPARSERAVAVAAKENRVVELEREDEKYEDLNEENFILLSMATSQYLLDSERWAGILLDEMKSRTDITIRGVDQAGFYVLMGASMPAILIECGYLSNPDDVRLLGAERGRQLIAESIAASIVKMKVEMEAAAR